MTEHTIAILSALKILTALLGIYFVAVALRAYRRHHDRGLGVLVVAIALLTTATLVEGLVYQILGLDLATAHIAEATLSLAGFAVLAWSIRT